jgi:hypothetical protein
VADPLCTVDDVAARLGVTIEPGSPEHMRTEAACGYVSAVLRARFPMIPATPVPDPVNVVATEVTVRYLGADPATGGLQSETIGGYSYRRSAAMGSTALTDDEYLVMAPYGLGKVVAVVLSNGPARSGYCRCGYGPDVECLAVGHAPSAPLNERTPMP